MWYWFLGLVYHIGLTMCSYWNQFHSVFQLNSSTEAFKVGNVSILEQFQKEFQCIPRADNCKYTESMDKRCIYIPEGIKGTAFPQQHSFFVKHGLEFLKIKLYYGPRLIQNNMCMCVCVRVCVHIHTQTHMTKGKRVNSRYTS